MRTRRPIRRNPQGDFGSHPNRTLLIDGSRGVYIPQQFAKLYSLSCIGCKKEDMAILRVGPDHDDYWDAWDDVLRYAHWVSDGVRYRLEQDDDLFAVPE